MTRQLISLTLAGLAGTFAPPLAAAEPVTSPPSLVGVVFNVADPERELAFYRDVFGLSLAMTLDHGTSREYILRFAGPGASPALVLQHDAGPARRSKRVHGNAFNRLVLRVTDMNAVITRLNGLKLPHSTPSSDPKGYRVLHTTDPEGFSLEIIQAAPPSAG